MRVTLEVVAEASDVIPVTVFDEMNWPDDTAISNLFIEVLAANTTPVAVLAVPLL